MATGMPGALPGMDDSYKAAADLSAKRWYFVKLSAAETVNVTTADTDIPIGILQDKPDTAGDSAKVRIEGLSLLKLGGTVTRNTYIMSHTDGTGIAATNNKPAAALALQSGVSGDLIKVKVTNSYVSSS